MLFSGAGGEPVEEEPFGSGSCTGVSRRWLFVFVSSEGRKLLACSFMDAEEAAVRRLEGGWTKLEFPVAVYVVDGERRFRLEGARGVSPADWAFSFCSSRSSSVFFGSP